MQQQDSTTGLIIILVVVVAVVVGIIYMSSGTTEPETTEPETKDSDISVTAPAFRIVTDPVEKANMINTATITNDAVQHKIQLAMDRVNQQSAVPVPASASSTDSKPAASAQTIKDQNAVLTGLSNMNAAMKAALKHMSSK